MTAAATTTLRQVALLMGATAILYGLAIALRVAPCLGAFALVAVVAWPIWRYRREYALFERRAILAGVMREDSKVRRWLWAGHIPVAVQGLGALAWAAALLLLATGMGAWHWGVLAADAAVVAILARPLGQWMSRNVRDEQLGLAVRRWPLRWINFALLAIAFFLVDYYVAGAPDTRSLAWRDVGESAFAARADAACPVTGWLLGSIAAVDALAWHAAQVIIPTLADQRLRFAAWAVFLLQAGVVAIAITRLHLGLLAATERSSEPGTSRVFAAALAFAFAAIVGLAWLFRDLDRTAVTKAMSAMLESANPCRIDTAGAARLRARLDGELARLRTAEHERTSGEIDAALARVFAGAENGVDQYLDWYFSVLGEYQRLLSPELGDLMHRKLQEAVFGADFGARIESASRAIAEASAQRVGKAAGGLGAVITQRAQAEPCLPGRLDLPALPSLERDAIRATTSVAGGVAVGLAVRAAARGAAGAAAARVASRPVFRGAASLGGRVVAKRAGTAAAGGATGLACGPASPICALVLGGLAWITFDKALVEIDELRMRPEMRQEMLAALREQQREIAEQLRAAHGAAVDRSVDAANGALDRVFIPAHS